MLPQTDDFRCLKGVDRWLFEIQNELSSAQGEADVNRRPDPAPNHGGVYEQRFNDLSRTAVVHNGRELQSAGLREDDGDAILHWLQARLELIIATWRNDLRADLTRMIRQIEAVSSSETDWIRLRAYLDRVDPEFGSHLEGAAPGMSLLERKISLLMGCGMPDEEIARTLGQPAAEIAHSSQGIVARLTARTSGEAHATP